MLLVIDVGNTNTSLGVYDGGAAASRRGGSRRRREQTADE